MSVKLRRIEPAGEAGHCIELSEQAAHQRVGIILSAQLIELTEDPGQRLIGGGDGPLREVLALGCQALTMFEEFLAIEVGQGADGRF